MNRKLHTNRKTKARPTAGVADLRHALLTAFAVLGFLFPSFPAAAQIQNRAVTVVAGPYHTCSILLSGLVKCWGRNDAGQLGVSDGVNRGDSSAPGHGVGDVLNLAAIPGPTIQVVLGERHTCTLSDEGSVYCFGDNTFGQLGRLSATGSYNSVITREVTKIVAGANHTCALKRTAQVVCWGDNRFGQLGQGNTTNSQGSVSTLPINLGTGALAIDIAATNNSTCALLGQSLLMKCWGHNANGRLGLGDTVDRGTQSGQMGDSLPTLGNINETFTSVVKVMAGGNEACAYLNSYHVKCWGANTYGNLGVGDVNDRGDQPNEVGGGLPAVDGGPEMLQVGMGANHMCARLMTTQVQCWGYNGYGQLGLGDLMPRGGSPGQVGLNLPAINLGTGRTAVQISSGYDHNCARLDDGTVKCWGRNDYGQLGLGDTNTRGGVPGQMGDALLPVDMGIDTN